MRGLKGHPGNIRREIIMWSGTQGVWKRRAFVLPPTRRVQSHFGNWPVSPIRSLLAGQRALQFKQLFSSQTPHALRDPPRPSWKLVLGSVRQVRGFQLEFSDALHPTFTYLETRRARKLARHHWPTSSLECDTDDKELISHASVV